MINELKKVAISTNNDIIDKLPDLGYHLNRIFHSVLSFFNVFSTKKEILGTKIFLIYYF